MMDLVNKYSPKSEGGMMSLVDKYDPKKKKVKKKEEAPAAKQVPLKPEYDILNDVAPTKKTVEKKTNVVNEKTNPAMLKKNQVNEKTNPLMLRPSKDTPAESLNKMVVGGLKDSVRPDMELYRPLSGKTKIDAPKPESYSDYKRNQREEVKQDWLRPGRDPINKYIAEPMFQGFDAASGLVESLTTPASDLKDKSVGGYLKNVATNLDKDLKEISPHNHIPGQPVEDEIKIGRGLTGVENAYTAAINAVKSGKPLDQENWTSKSNVLKYDSFDSMPPDVKASYVASFGDNNTAANVQTELNRLRSVGFVDQQANELLGLPLGMPMAKVSMFPIETLEQGYKTYTAKKKWNLSKIGNTVGGLAFDMVLPVGGLTAPGKAVAQTGLAIAKGTGKLATALPGVRNIPRIGAAAKEAKLIEDMRNAFAVKNGIQDALAGARTETVGGMQIANPKAPVAKTRPGSGFKLDAEGNPVAKEIHEMTVGEFRSLDHTLTGKNGGKTTIRYTEKRNLTSAERAINEKIDSAHADAVAKAYKSGKYVPDEVLSEYGLVQKQNVKGRIPQEQQLSRVEREYTQALETLNNKYQNPDLKGTIREIDPSVHWLDYIRDNDGIDLRKLMYEMDKYQNLDSYIEMSAKYTREELVKEITATRNNIAKLQKEAKVAKDSQDYEQLQKLYSAIDENTDTMNTFQIMMDNKRVVEPKLKPTKKVKEPTYRGIEPVLNPENAVVEAPGKVRTRQPHEMSFDEFKNQLHDVEMPDGSIKKMRYEAGTTDPLQYKVNQMIKDAHRKAVMDAHWSGKKLPEYVRSEYKLADVSAIPEPEPLPTNETITTGTGKNAEVPLEVTHAHDSQSELASLNRAVAEASSEATNPVIQAVVERGEDIYKPADLKKLDKQKQKQIELINLLAKEYGLDVKFIEPNITAYGELVSPHNGIYHNGTLYINTATKNPLHVAFGHELGEAIKAETPDLYEKFVKVFSEEFRNGTKFADEYIASLKSVTEANAGGTPINAELMAEMANDFIGTQIGNKKFWQIMYDKAPEVAQKFLDTLTDMIRRIKNKITPNMRADKLVNDLERVQNQAAEVLQEFKSRKPLKTGETKFSMNRDGAYLRKNITPDNAHNLTYDEFRAYFRNPTKLKSKYFGYSAAPEEVKAIEQKYYAKTYEVINQFEKELGVPLSKPGENKVASDFLEKLAYDYAKPELAMLRQAQLEESWAAVNKAIEKEYVDMIDAARAKGKTIPPAAQKSYDSIKSGKPQFSMNRFMSMTPPIKKGKSLSEISMKIRESVINEAASLARAEDTIMGTWQKPLDASVSLKKQFALNKGAFSAADMRIKTELEPIIQAAEAKGYTMEDLGKYALAYHQETMLMRATKVNGKPVTFNAPTRTIMDTVQQYKDLEPERRALVEYSQRLLDYMVESGNMKKSFANYLKKKYPDYVPMHYEYADDYMGIATGQLGGYSNAKTPLKRITADPAAAPTINPIESIIKNTYLFENAASRNRVARTLEHLAKRDLLGAYVKEVPKPGNKSNRTNTITAYVDGVKRYFEVDKDMYEVLSGMVKGEALNPLVKILGMPANLLRSGATLAPEFIARNPIRDIATAFFNSKSGFNPFTDFARGFGSYLAHEGGLGGTVAKKLGADPTLYEGFIRNRGGMGIMAATKRPETWKAAQKLSGKSVGKKIVDYVTVLPKLKKYTAATEYGTRVGEYSRALKKGVSAEEAAFRGRDLIDFSRRGRNMKNVNALYAFLNADIQGKAKTVNTIRDLWKYGTAKEKAMYLTKVIGVSAGLSIAAQNLYHLASEEQRRRIDAVDQRTKDTFWLIPLPFGDQVARIPKSFEYAVVSNVTERMLRQIPREAFLKYFADDSEHVDSGLAGELASVGGFNYTPSRMLPTALVPAVEGIANQSFFWGNDVIPKAEQGLLLEDQKDINTSTAAEVLAKGYRSIPGVGQEYSDGNGVANFGSPRVMDNMIRGYTGGLGTLVSSGIDAAAGIGSEGPKRVAKGAAQKPLLKAFLVNDIAPAPSIQRLYSLKTELEAEKKSADLHGTAFLREGIYDIVKEATDQMGENNKLIKEITNDNSDPKVKLANVKSLKLQNNQIANNYARMLKLLK